VVALSEVRCYYCEKVVENENDLVVKSVQVGWFSSERKPFHMDCWTKYHGRKWKRDAIAFVALADGAFLLFFSSFFLILGTIGLIAIGLCFALLICLVVAYYRIEE